MRRFISKPCFCPELRHIASLSRGSGLGTDSQKVVLPEDPKGSVPFNWLQTVFFELIKSSIQILSGGGTVSPAHAQILNGTL